MNPMGLLKQSVQQLYRWRADWRWAGDWSTLVKLRRPRRGLFSMTVRLGGRRVKIWVRGNTLDTQLARQILCDDSEYRLPAGIAPKIIFDIGANIGMTTLYFATLYPEARIVCFEPLPENLDVLRRNVAPLGDRVTVIPKGLGESEGTFPYHPSNDPLNFGGGGFKIFGGGLSRSIDLPVTTLRRVCAELGIERVDLIKIDTEGAEWSVLEGSAPGMIADCPVIIGELHGHRDGDVLGRLGQSHRLAFAKALHRDAYPFLAVRSEPGRALAA